MLGKIYLMLIFPEISSGTTSKIWTLWLLQSPTTWKSKCWACSKITSRRVFRKLLVGLLAKMCQQKSKMLRTGGLIFTQHVVFGGTDIEKKLCILNSVHCLLELCHKPRRTSRTPNTRWFAQVWLMTTKRLWATTSSETRSDKIWMFTVFFLFFGSQKPSPRWMGIDTWPKQLELVQQFHHVVLKVFMFCCWFGFLWGSSNSDFFF